MSYSVKETGMRIHWLRNTLNLSAKEFSAALDISTQQLSRIEHGTRGASIDLIVRISEQYDVQTDYLLMGKSNHKDAYEYVIKDIIFRLENFLSTLNVEDEDEE